MRKIFIFMVVLALALSCPAQRSTATVPTIEGDILHTIQNAWEIADSTTSAGTEPTALTNLLRTYKRVQALIAAASSGNDEISIFKIPSKWNGVRFMAGGIVDNGTVVQNIYLGTLGGLNDCSLGLTGTLSWVIGPQESIYSQIAFTSGGTYVPKIGDTVTGNSSGETAIIVEISALSSGTWAAGTAAGTITYKSDTGTFTNSETLTIKKASRIITDDAYTHAASDLVRFLLADAVTLSNNKTWSPSSVITWKTSSPADDDTEAIAEIDVKGADIMIIVTSATSADSKSLVTGY